MDKQITESSGQSRKHSLAKSAINAIASFLAILLAQIIVFPWFGIEIPFVDKLGIALIFTILGMAQSYLKRIFNKQLLKHENTSESSGDIHPIKLEITDHGRLRFRRIDPANPPKGVILAACLTYDCGWVVDSVWFDEDKRKYFVTGSVNSDCEAHLPYSLYITSDDLLEVALNELDNDSNKAKAS